jgi:hypothetical protein
MVFLFPDDDTLHFALAGGQVPPAISLAPARAGRDADGRPWVQPAGALPKALPTTLRRLGVQVTDGAPADGREVAHWLQALALRRDPTPPALNDQTPVLFELPDPAGLAALVGEMLRLGNDRQGFRVLERMSTGARAREESDGPSRSRAPALMHSATLLRVIGPPYYSLLRALDHLGPDAPRAYLERAPRVWVEVGYTHPLVEQLRAPDGQSVLLRPPQEWVYLDDAPFRDVYEVLEFTLPVEPMAWADAPPTEKLVVPLRLAPGAGTDPAELWVLRGESIEQLDSLVRDADDRLLARLSFAVGVVAGERVAVLRARPGKGGPPVLVLDALACRPFLRLPNLFLPVGRLLRPPLRRDAVRQLLADDPDRVTWLVPQGDGTFVPQSLPDAAFRPLADWVEYVIDRDADALAAWVKATRFDFGRFVSKEELIVASPAAPRERRPREERPAPAAEPASKPRSTAATRVRPKAPAAPAADVFTARPASTPNELQKQLKAAEERFLTVEGPLDDPERLALWPELGRLNAALNHPADAALCWASALWEPSEPPEAWAWGWVASERALPRPALTAADLDRLLGPAQPAAADLRPLAAALVWAARQKPVPAALRERLPAVQRYLERHDSLLPVRMVWLAWHGLAQLAGSDVLALARVRDRLLERLLAEGLGAERDLPGFLRFAGQREGDRLRTVREQAVRFRLTAQEWARQTIEPKGVRDQTPAYIDLMFAFGLARLGEATACRDLLHQAATALEQSGDQAHAFLLEAFRYRIEQVLAGKPHAGPLPTEQIEFLNRWRQERATRPIDNSDPGSGGCYSADRMREQSRILDPHERYDPYRYTHLMHGTEMTKELAGLPDITDRGQLTARIRQLLGRTAGSPAAKGGWPSTFRVSLLSYALPLAHRLGEPFTIELLDLVLPALNPASPLAASDPQLLDDQAKLLERALFFAAHFDRPDLVRAFVDRLLRLMETHPGSAVLEVAGPLVGQTLRSLRKLGLRDEAERLLAQITQVLFHGRSIAQLKAEEGKQWLHTLNMLLQVATGWMYYEGLDRAAPILNEARATIVRDGESYLAKESIRYVDLIRAYIAALGHLPIHEAIGRVEELLNSSPLSKLPNTQTSASHYSRFHLNIVEAIVFALVNEDFALGPVARRWLDDDEYLVRRRIHRDVRAALANAGM